MGKAMEDMAVVDGSHGPKAAQVVDVSLLARAAAALRGLPDAEMAAIAGVLDGTNEEARQSSREAKPPPVQLSRLYEKRRNILKREKMQSDYGKSLEE